MCAEDVILNISLTEVSLNIGEVEDMTARTLELESPPTYKSTLFTDCQCWSLLDARYTSHHLSSIDVSICRHQHGHCALFTYSMQRPLGQGALGT